MTSAPLRVGVHLPQYGRVAGAEAITSAARRAEELGFADVWVSDHTVHPAAQDYPSPYLYDPLATLTWAAAVTASRGARTRLRMLAVACVVRITVRPPGGVCWRGFRQSRRGLA